MHSFRARVAAAYDVTAPQPYKTLNDAAVVAPGLQQGPTKIWYYRPEHARDLGLGVEWCRQHGRLPDPRDLQRTHGLLGSIKATDPDQIYRMLQGEVWSPAGESRQLIKSLHLTHTSMSVGDVVEIGSKVMMIDNDGFHPLA